MIKELNLKKVDMASNERRDLILSVVLDLIGMGTFTIPFLGEFFDILWAPISAYLMTRIYKGTSGKVASVIDFVEEIIPFTDVIPTFTIMWYYTYRIKKQPQKKGAK